VSTTNTNAAVETYQHRFQSGRCCSARVTYRHASVPEMDCSNPGGDFTPQEWPEYVEWRKFVAASVLANLDPAAVAMLALSDDDDS
jgi:hypothetical protein